MDWIVESYHFIGILWKNRRKKFLTQGTERLFFQEIGLLQFECFWLRTGRNKPSMFSRKVRIFNNRDF